MKQATVQTIDALVRFRDRKRRTKLPTEIRARYPFRRDWCSVG